MQKTRDLPPIPELPVKFPFEGVTVGKGFADLINQVLEKGIESDARVKLDEAYVALGELANYPAFAFTAAVIELHAGKMIVGRVTTPKNIAVCHYLMERHKPFEQRIGARTKALTIQSRALAKQASAGVEGPQVMSSRGEWVANWPDEQIAHHHQLFPFTMDGVTSRGYPPSISNWFHRTVCETTDRVRDYLRAFLVNQSPYNGVETAIYRRVGIEYLRNTRSREMIRRKLQEDVEAGHLPPVDYDQVETQAMAGLRWLVPADQEFCRALPPGSFDLQALAQWRPLIEIAQTIYQGEKHYKDGGDIAGHLNRFALQLAQLPDDQVRQHLVTYYGHNTLKRMPAHDYQELTPMLRHCVEHMEDPLQRLGTQLILLRDSGLDEAVVQKHIADNKLQKEARRLVKKMVGKDTILHSKMKVLLGWVDDTPASDSVYTEAMLSILNL
ncbi:hypothetical protein HNP46_005715 [Pseudomonas nitritireducens]|uniref:Uncharacterized protein n=1 Tax=Pseudomonas nitroreducens TaxID=46680 RepID=A0A7W7KRA3_PSENT|nr:hypothetical protein [Pseudomonas nitritireducens]MBB4866808.1 hypothetical protein [Pseudomonas nitritireducens]